MSLEQHAASSTDDPTAAAGAVVVVQNPLPLDVAGTLMRLVGARWPNTRILTPEHRLFPATGTGHMALWIPDSDRFAPEDPDAEGDALAEPLPTPTVDPDGVNLEAMLTSLEGDTVSMGASEWIARFFCGLFRQTFEDTGAQNYLQMDLRDDTGEGRWYVTVRAPGGDDPATRASQLEADLAATRAALLCALDGNPPESLPDELRGVVDDALDGDWGSVEQLVADGAAAAERAALLRSELER